MEESSASGMKLVQYWRNLRLPRFVQAVFWALIGGGLVFLHDLVPALIFLGSQVVNPRVQAVALIFYLSAAGYVWLCLSVIDPWLRHRVSSSMAARIGLGLLILLGGLTLNAVFVLFHLFPLIVAREVSVLALHSIVYKSCTLGVLVYFWVLFNQTRDEVQNQTEHLQEETSQLSTDLTRTELTLLEAQIEPHFLFNTLAFVKHQYKIDAQAADQVMHGLIEYLARAGPALRQTDWNLAQELELVGLYLDILRHRFGPRLRYEIRPLAQHLPLRIPALILATLVENSVRHGITPKAEGGCVTIEMQEEGQMLCIHVIDDGVGLRQTSGTGLGLSTVRARLRSRFGLQASLMVEPDAVTGVRATLRIPFAAR